MRTLTGLSVEERQVAERTRALLQDWEQEIDDSTLQRLRSVRERVLARARRGGFPPGDRVPGRRH